MPKTITEPQGLWLDLIRMSSYDEFDGEKVVEELLANKGLWESVIMLQGPPGITLRDLPEGFHNVATLFILVPEGKESKMEKLARTWKADEINWVENPSSFLGGGEGSVLSVWWD